MKIGNSLEVSSAAVGADKPSAAQTGRATAGSAQGGSVAVGAKPAPEASAKLELSSNAKLLSGVAENGDFDSAKVERITQAIADGKFTINANVIADKLIANAQEMLSRMTPH